MEMFCYQCQEALKGTGCTAMGICGIPAEVSNLQDLAIYGLKGLALVHSEANKIEIEKTEIYMFMTDTLFSTISNVNFSKDDVIGIIKKGLSLRDNLIAEVSGKADAAKLNHDSVTWFASSNEEIEKKAQEIGGKIAGPNEDVQSLRSLILYGIKGIAAYYHHAANLNFSNIEIQKFVQKALCALTNDELTVEETIALVMETGKFGVDVMALLDKANTET